MSELGDMIKKEDVVEKLRDSWFSTYKLRMAITGRVSHNIKITQDEINTEGQAWLKEFIDLYLKIIKH